MSINPSEIANEAIRQLSLQVELGNLETLGQITHLRSQSDQIGLTTKDIRKLYELEAKATKALVDTIQAESVNLMSKVNEDEFKETAAFVKFELRNKIPNIGACIDYQNNVASTFVKYVLTSDTPHEAAMRITQLIRIAEQFRQNGNFFMFDALYASLSDSNVGTRLKLLVSMLTKNKLNLLQDFAEIMDYHSSFSNLRHAQAATKFYDSFIPSLSLLMNDLTKSEGEDVPNPALTHAEQEKLKLERKAKKEAAKSKILEGFRLFKLHHDYPQSTDTYKKFKIDTFTNPLTANQYSDQLRDQAKELEKQDKLTKLPSRAGSVFMTNLTSTITNNKNAATQTNGDVQLDLQQTINPDKTSFKGTVVTIGDLLNNDLINYREDIMRGGIDQAIIQLTNHVNAANKLLLFRNISDTESDNLFSELKDIKFILDITRLQLMLLKSAKQGNNELYVKIWTSLSDYKSQLTKLISENKSSFVKRFCKMQIATEAYNQIALLELKKKLHDTPKQVAPLEDTDLLINRLFELHDSAFEKAKTEPLQNVMPIIEEINQLRIKLEQLSAEDNYLSSREQLNDALEFNKKYLENLNQMIANRRESDALDKGFIYSNKSSPQSVAAQPIPMDDVEINFDDIDELIKPVAAPLDDFIVLIRQIHQKCDELKDISNTHTSYNEQINMKVSSLINEINQIKSQLNQTKKNIDLESLFKEIDKVIDIYKKPQEESVLEPLSDIDSQHSSMIASSASHDSLSNESQILSDQKVSSDSLGSTDTARASTESIIQPTHVEVFQPLIEIEQRIIPIRIKIDEIFKSKSTTEKERKHLIMQLKELTQQLHPFMDEEHFHRLQHRGSGLGTSYPSDKQKNQFNKEFFEYNDAARRAFNVYQVISYLSVKIENEKITVVPESQSFMSLIRSAWNGFKNMIGFGTKTSEQDTTTIITSITGIPQHKEEQKLETKIVKKETKLMPRSTALRASRFKVETPENSDISAPSIKQNPMSQTKKNI